MAGLHFLPLLLLLVVWPNAIKADTPTLLHEWVTLDFDWESDAQKQAYLANGTSVPLACSHLGWWIKENCALAGLKV